MTTPQEQQRIFSEITTIKEKVTTVNEEKMVKVVEYLYHRVNELEWEVYLLTKN